jgi:hypothetical protein
MPIWARSGVCRHAVDRMTTGADGSAEACRQCRRFASFSNPSRHNRRADRRRPLAERIARPVLPDDAAFEYLVIFALDGKTGPGRNALGW